MRPHARGSRNASGTRRMSGTGTRGRDSGTCSAVTAPPSIAARRDHGGASLGGTCSQILIRTNMATVRIAWQRSLKRAQTRPGLRRLAACRTSTASATSATSPATASSSASTTSKPGRSSSFSPAFPQTLHDCVPADHDEGQEQPQQHARQQRLVRRLRVARGEVGVALAQPLL